MKKTKVLVSVFLGVLILISCQETMDIKKTTDIPPIIEIKDSVIQQPIIINILPLGYVNPEYINIIKTSIKEFYGYDCVVLPNAILSDDILAKSKTRYDASKIIRKYRSQTYTLVITEKDIACVTNKSPEWGIFGLSYISGKSCVLSTYRLKKNATNELLTKRIKKIALHELGHNFGLDHCVNSTVCMMSSADGTISTVDRERIWFCDKCREQLKK